jgi:hypothetical protein
MKVTSIMILKLKIINPRIVLALELVLALALELALALALEHTLSRTYTFE